MSLLSTLFAGLVALAVVTIMVGLIVLIIYAVYREVRGGGE